MALLHAIVANNEHVLAEASSPDLQNDPEAGNTFSAAVREADFQAKCLKDEVADRGFVSISGSNGQLHQVNTILRKIPPNDSKVRRWVLRTKSPLNLVVLTAAFTCLTWLRSYPTNWKTTSVTIFEAMESLSWSWRIKNLPDGSLLVF